MDTLQLGRSPAAHRRSVHLPTSRGHCNSLSFPSFLTSATLSLVPDPPILFSRLPLSLFPSFETPPSRPLPFLYSILRDPCLFSGPGDTGVNTHPPTWLLLVDSPHSSHTDPISLLELPVHWARFSCGMHFPIVSSLLCLAGLAAVPVSGYGGNDPDIKAIPVSQALPRSCA